MTWWRKFGTAEMPVRQSALNDIASQNGCGKRFFYDHDALVEKPKRETAGWKPVLGTAVHAVIERALTKTWPKMVALFGPDAPPRPDGVAESWAPKALRDRVDEILREELTRAAEGVTGIKGARVEWYDEDPETEIAAGVAMVIGALRTTVERAEEVLACEAPFRAQLDEYHLEGTMDLVYRPRGAEPGTVAIADWKTGARKLHQVLLDHGYQGAIYSHALEHGVLWPGVEGREKRFATWPAAIDIVHLRDFVPYVKKTKDKKPGDLRGPGWCRSQRSAGDVARLRVSLATVVGTVRMGRRLERLGEQCARCPYRGPCLGSEGYGPSKDEQRAIAAATRGIEFDDGLDGEAA